MQVSDDKDTDRIGRLIEQAKTSVKDLDELDATEVTETEARKAWKKVFRHSLFDEAEKAAKSAFTETVLGGTGLAAPFIASQAAAVLSDRERAERMESAVHARRESGGGGKPWSH